MSKLRDLMLADLELSGLDAEHADILQLRPLNREATFRFLYPKKSYIPSDFTASSYLIPYRDHRGKLLPEACYRLRKLRGQWGDKKNFKYNQRAGTIPHIYFPGLIEWPANSSGKVKVKRIVITEGEKKSEAAALCGIHCIALGGVASHGSKKHRIDLLSEFDSLDLTETIVEVCYDSDIFENPNVVAATDSLVGKLLRRRCKTIRLVKLTAEEAGTKVGLDEYLAQFKTRKEAKRAFLDLPRTTDHRDLAMIPMSADLRYLESDKKIYSISKEMYMTETEAQTYYGWETPIMDPDNPKQKISQLKLWVKLRNPDRTNVRSLTYEPAGPKEIVDARGHRYVNVFTPSTHKPVSKKPTLWLSVLRDHLLADLPENLKDLFIEWLAYPIQNPGKKINYATFIYSLRGGTGKNLILENPLRAIYGHNFKKLSGESGIVSDYNEWAVRKQLVLIDEIYVGSRKERETIMGRLKDFITGEVLDVAEKFKNRTEYPNRANYVLLSNHDNALHLTPGDRKFFVIHGNETPLSQGQSAELAKFYEKEGLGAIHNYLLKLPLSKFNPFAEAPDTEAKKKAIVHSEGPLESALTMIISQPDKLFSANGMLTDKEVFTPDDIQGAVNHYLQTKLGVRTLSVSTEKLGTELENRGIPKRRIKYRTGKNVSTLTLYAMFNRDKWANQLKHEWLLHYRTHDKNHGSVIKEDNVIQIADRKKGEKK